MVRSIILSQHVHSSNTLIFLKTLPGPSLRLSPRNSPKTVRKHPEISENHSATESVITNTPSFLRQPLGRGRGSRYVHKLHLLVVCMVFTHMQSITYIVHPKWISLSWRFQQTSCRNSAKLADLFLKLYWSSATFCWTSASFAESLVGKHISRNSTKDRKLGKMFWIVNRKY